MQLMEEEFKKCALSFEYFTTKCQVIHPKKGLVPFDMYSYQKRLVEALDANRFVIATKFRQGGFTITTLVYFLWLCTHKLDQRVCYFAKMDSEACFANHRIMEVIRELPDWMMPKIGKQNDHIIEFVETNSTMRFSTLEPSKGTDRTNL